MEATIMAIMINEINNQYTVKSSLSMETFSFKPVLNKSGQKGYTATYGEMLQLRQIQFFKPTRV